MLFKSIVVLTTQKKRTVIFIRTYSELIQLPTFEERFNYLKLQGQLGVDTFGTYGKRWLNQHFYKSREWKDIKREVIMRDNGCDLGLPEYELLHPVKVMVHHMNVITDQDIINRTPFLLDPEYLITCSMETHNAIHYGDLSVSRYSKDPVIRQPGDQCPWLGGPQVVAVANPRGFMPMSRQ